MVCIGGCPGIPGGTIGRIVIGVTGCCGGIHICWCPEPITPIIIGLGLGIIGLGIIGLDAELAGLFISAIALAEALIISCICSFEGGGPGGGPGGPGGPEGA